MTECSEVHLRKPGFWKLPNVKMGSRERERGREEGSDIMRSRRARWNEKGGGKKEKQTEKKRARERIMVMQENEEVPPNSRNFGEE